MACRLETAWSLLGFGWAIRSPRFKSSITGGDRGVHFISPPREDLLAAWAKAPLAALALYPVNPDLASRNGRRISRGGNSFTHADSGRIGKPCYDDNNA